MSMNCSSIDVFPIKEHVKETLKKHCLKTDKDFLAYSLDELARMTSLSIEELDRVHTILKGGATSSRPESAFDCLERNSSKNIIPSLSNAIDDLLDGGFQTGRMYQIYGEAACGKSQLCMQLACTVQIPRSIGGLEASAIYIDTQNKFRSERFIEMGLATIERVSQLLDNNGHNLTVKRLLENVFIFPCACLQELTNVVLYELEKLVIENRPKLIVLDDVAFQFRNDLYMNEEYGHFKRKSQLQIAQKLKSLASNYDLCVICVNQVACDLNKQKVVPSLGALWNQTPYGHLNLSMVETYNGQRIRSIQGEKACFKTKRVHFSILGSGIRDVDDESTRDQLDADEKRMCYQ